jgi:CheY-like chemotaxis protein
MTLKEVTPILLVDKDAASLELQVRILEHTGYRVFTAENAFEALARARALRPAAVAVNLTQDADLTSVFQQFREDPVLRKIPVIFVSTIGGEENDLLHQPVKGASIQATLEKILAKSDRGSRRKDRYGAEQP